MLSLVAAMRVASAADQALLLEVVVNGYSTGKIGEFVLRDTRLLSRPAELTDLGLRVPAGVVPAPDGLIALSALPGVGTRLDQATQVLHVTASVDRLLPELLRVAAPVEASGQVESGTGATLNYDISGTAVGRRKSGTGLFELRGFSPLGVASSGLLVAAGAGRAGASAYTATRLDSSYVYSDAAALRRYRLGDFASGSLGWTRPVRLGGVQINADFAMRPDLVTFPLPTIGGSATVPSTVDLLVNGTRLLSRQVQPGPFQIPQLPVVTGAGTVAMTITDALGRQVTTTLPFYASASLLAPGLQSYSVEFGAVRRSWGLVSNDYGEFAGSATYRRGLSSDVTIEGHAEGMSGQFLGGVGVAVNVGDYAVLNAAAAASGGSGRGGTLVSLGIQRIGRVFSIGASASFSDHAFRDVAAMSGDPVPRRQINANAGLSLGQFGSLGVAYTGVDRDALPTPVRFFLPPGSTFVRSDVVPGGSFTLTGQVVSFQPAQHAHIVTASYSVQLAKFSLYATGFRDFAKGGSSGVLFGVTVPLGSRTSASASGGSGSGGSSAQVQAMQSVAAVGDWGYHAYASAGRPNHEFAEAQYKSPWGLVSAGADRIGPQTALRAEVQGAVSLAGGGLFASNTINDSFAVVDTNGTPAVRVLSENRDVGRTDSAGRLLVPELRSFDVNRIAINPEDVPLDATIPYVTREVRPQDRSGVVVRFPVQVSHGALVRLVDNAGAALPVGSTATLVATGTAVPVGHGGEAYVQDLSAQGNRLVVQRPNGQRCGAVFDYRAVPGEIPAIGPLRCLEIAP